MPLKVFKQELLYIARIFILLVFSQNYGITKLVQFCLHVPVLTFFQAICTYTKGVHIIRIFIFFYLFSTKLQSLSIFHRRGRRGHDCMVVGFTTTCAISAITAKVVNSNPVHGEVYSIQHYLIKLVSDLRQIRTRVSLTNKSDRHDIAEILLKVVLKHHKPNHSPCT